MLQEYDIQDFNRERGVGWGEFIFTQNLLKQIEKFKRVLKGYFSTPYETFIQKDKYCITALKIYFFFIKEGCKIKI